MTLRVVESHEWRWVFITGGLLLILLSLPFLWAYAAAVPDRYFMGILVNPQDGISYIAKMAQGYNGEWLMRLPYTPDSHSGVFLYTFYLVLGHFASFLRVDPVLVFHVARLIGGMFMFLMLYRFAADWTDSLDQRRISWSFMVLSAGFGWIALLAAGYPSSDVLMIPEAFPLQAAYANAHFPWAIAIAAGMAHLLLRAAVHEPHLEADTNTQSLAVAAGAIMLVSMAPFVLIPIGAGYGALLAWLWRTQNRFPARELKWGSLVIIFGLPLALYTAWAFSGQNSVMAGWLAQNKTPSPPIWDYLIAFGPLLILSAVGIWGSRRALDGGDVFLLGWIISTMVLLYLPISLQRRFAMGVTIPLGILAARGVWRVIALPLPTRARFLVVLSAFLSFIPTTILTIILPLFGTLSAQHGEYFYVTSEEIESLNWLGSNADPDNVVLASPSLSLFIPTVGPRVVYGHPFETVNSVERRQAVVDYYSGEDCSVVDAEGVSYIVVGPREIELAGSDQTCLPEGAPVFTSGNGEVEIYAADDQ